MSVNNYEIALPTLAEERQISLCRKQAVSSIYLFLMIQQW